MEKLHASVQIPIPAHVICLYNHISLLTIEMQCTPAYTSLSFHIVYTTHIYAIKQVEFNNLSRPEYLIFFSIINI